MIAATTRIALLSAPLRSRFSGGVHRLEMYSEEEIMDIVRRSARILGIILDDHALREIAVRSRNTPRTANYLLKRIRDYAQVKGKEITREVVHEALQLLGVDEEGLTNIDRQYVEVLKNKFGGGPVGLKTLAAALNEDEGTLEDVIEPYLLQKGLIEKTARGRTIVEKGLF